MRQVIYQFSNEADAVLVGELREKTRRECGDFQFVDLVRVLSPGEREWTGSDGLGDHVGVDLIGNPYAVIWNPSPLERDWFRTLKSGRYKGKTILLYQDGSREFMAHADHAIAIPVDGLVEIIYAALNSSPSPKP